MRKFITSVTFTRVPKMAFAPLVTTLAGVVEQHDPVALHIDGMYQLLLDVMPELDYLQNQANVKDKTEVLKALWQKRRTLLVTILGQSRMTAKAQVQAEEAHRTTVLPFIDKHLRTILNVTQNEQKGMLGKMFEELKDNTTMNDALVALGWKASFDELSAVEARIAHIEAVRRKCKAASPDMRTSMVKSVISEAIMDLLNRIESAQKEFKELDYMPLIKELNALLTPIAADQKARDTRSRRALEAEKTTTVNNTDTKAV